MLRTVQLWEERVKSRSLELVHEYSRVHNFQNPSTKQSDFLNRWSGVRLSPGPPSFQELRDTGDHRFAHCRDFCGDPTRFSYIAITRSALNFSSFRTASRLCSGVGCTYRIVVEILEWPINSLRVARSTPAMSERDPTVWRRVEDRYR